MNKALQELLMDARVQATAHSVRSLMEEMGWTSEKSMDVLHVLPEDRPLVQALL